MSVTSVINKRAPLGVTIAAVVILIGGPLVTYFYHNQITAWWFLRSYHPPARVAQLATQADLTTAGRNVFYRAAPQILTQRAQMATHCSIDNPQVAELGCYTSNEHIYLLNITDPALSNEMIVTAAYEMLHPVYEQMNSSDRKSINSALEAEAKTVTDPSILSQIQIYAQDEPDGRDEELYSIFGTEYPIDNPVLEASYSQYLGNRVQLVAYHQQFEQTYDGLSSRITTLGDQISATKSLMQRYQAAGEISQYNALVGSVNEQVDLYNSEVANLNRYGDDLFGQESAAATQ
jgi:hypothetical protein